MKTYKIWVCHQVLTGNKRVVKHFYADDCFFDEEFETTLTEWEECQTVKGIKNLYELVGYNENFVNSSRFSFQKKWYNETLAFRNKQEKEYYRYLETKMSLYEIFSKLSKEEIKNELNKNVKKEDFKIKFDFLPKDNLKGKIISTYYCISDENNVLINYNKIIEDIHYRNYKTDYISSFRNPLKKQRQKKGYTRYGIYYWSHHGNNLHNEMMQTVTPQEIKEIYEDYGVKLKPCKEKRKHLQSDLAYLEQCTKCERSWKKFRKHQWKEVNKQYDMV